MTLFFDYDLPERLIAQQPATPRDAARLLVVRRDTGTLEHHVFRDLPDLLSPGDLLVLNDTKVIPARVVGRRERTGGKPRRAGTPAKGRRSSPTAASNSSSRAGPRTAIG
jgi:S-adenosylmethionine:tRNA-ribosyltransferase-isomerase (queuine synthetase)